MSKWHPHTLGQLPYAVERLALDGVLLDEAFGGSLDHDEALGGCLDPGFCGRHVAFGGEQLDEALGGHHGFYGRLDKLVIAALLPGPPQRARLECGAVWQSCF